MTAIRAAVSSDLDALVELLAEHAEFERAALPADFDRRALHRFLFERTPPRAWCVVAESEGGLAGYATYSLEFSTWSAAEFVHMDCLYVRESVRNGGIGARLLHEVVEAARAFGCARVEWQTPSWNAGAMRFYERAGAIGSAKMRYRLHHHDASRAM